MRDLSVSVAVSTRWVGND